VCSTVRSRKGRLVNKTQLIEALSAHFDGNRRAAAHALESVVDTVMREVARGEKVAITGFGAFEKAIRPARMVRNPRTGERTRAKKTAVPKFRAGSELKAVVSGAKKLPKASTSSSTAKKSTGASKSTAKKTGAASKSTAKKSTAKKTSTAKKSSTAKKAPAKKTTAKKSSTAKKAPAKKTTAKKTSAARKAPAKKSATRRSTAKKS
jgi:DNA-binding protein HU-beta